MRFRTVGAVLAVVALLGATVVVGLGLAPTGGSLAAAWVSDTPRDNVRNHHAVGVGPNGDVVVAPVTEVPSDDVEMTARSCVLARLSPSNGSVLWRAVTPPSTCFSHALTEPAIADVDGDGAPEVLATSTEEALVAHDGRTGVEEWRVPLSTYGYGRPTVVQLPSASGAKAESVPEAETEPGTEAETEPGTEAETEPGTEAEAVGVGVVASDIGGHVLLVTGDGTVRWRSNLTRVLDADVTVVDRPVVADLADEGTAVVVGTNRGVVVLGPDGSVRWQRDGPATYVATTGTPDGSLVLTASYEGVRAFDAASGRPVWERPLTSSRLRAVDDADADGTPELYLGRVGGEVRAVDARTGETAWTTSVSVDEDVTVPPPVTADVSGDGRREVLAVTEDGRVVVLDPDTGVELAAYERSVPVWTYVTPADIDDDGAAEILVRYGDGRVVALQYRSAGRPLASLARYRPGPGQPRGTSSAT